MPTESYKFHGFLPSYKSGFFKFPTELESSWTYLTGAEQKVLDYILRQTYGYQKLEDTISLSQFTNGYGKRNKGCGVSRAQVQRVLSSLEEKGFIHTESNGYATRLIKLALRDNATPEPQKVGAASGQVAYLISLFRTIAPHRVDAFLVEKKQIQATERLLKHFAVADIERFIQTVQATNGQKYAPFIASPAELEIKLASLVNFVKKSKPATREMSF